VPDLRRELVLWLQTDFDASERHACEVLHVHRSSVRYQSQAKDQAPLTAHIKEIAAVRVRYGYKRIHVLSRREGWGVNHKRAYRLYCQEGLNLRRKRPRRHFSAQPGKQRHGRVFCKDIQTGLCVRPRTS
jgi:putative transposase